MQTRYGFEISLRNIYQFRIIGPKGEIVGMSMEPAAIEKALLVAMVVAGSVNAAHLPLPVLFTPVEQAEFNRFLADRPVPTSEADRKRLFQEFLSWRKARQPR
jgi:hypothetical protein